MTLRELDNLVKAGTLKSEAPNEIEFKGLIESGRKRLADARKDDISAESRFDLAYNAAHAFALAAMRWHGYRPANKRYIVFQALPHTLGIPTPTWRVLDKCHGLRNAFEYDGTFNVDARLLDELVKAAELLQKALSSLQA
jgi:hypothetical protein